MVMGILAHAILQERNTLKETLQNDFGGNLKKMSIKIPEAIGFLRQPQRLYEKRKEAMELLDIQLEKNMKKLMRGIIIK